MHTMILMLAFAGSGVSANVAAPVWQSDYRTAKVQALESSKPLAVFIGHGKNGWQNVLANTAFDEKTSKLLGEKYVCLYVDTDVSSGSVLAKAFEVPTSGLVISDRSGTIQAFSHAGTLTPSDMSKVLVRYSEMFQTKGTESLSHVNAPMTSTSGYTPSGATPGSPTPMYYYPGGYGSCPNGNCQSGYCPTCPQR